MIEIKGGRTEQFIRGWIKTEFGDVIPTGKIKDVLDRLLTQHPDSGVSYSSLNGTLKKLEADGIPFATEAVTAPKEKIAPAPIKFEVSRVEDMTFPDYQLHTTGKMLDLLLSDHEASGGLYGGTVNIVIGESGVGKSTVLLDLLSSVQTKNKKAKILYISSEMTKNDIGFYYKKTPAIGRVPTLLLMNYVEDGTMTSVLAQAFNDDYDIILLDSYQDVLVKLVEAEGWKAKKAESWLTGMMIRAAEENGCAILAIQHMTKGGTYAGSTYLKHATQAMIELRFDVSGHRYVEVLKNRRGGSAIGKRLYYSLDASGDVIYDEERFRNMEEMRKIEKSEQVNQQDLSKRFDSLFLPPEKVDEAVVADK